MRLSVFASGSKVNSLALQSGTTTLVVDLVILIVLFRRRKREIEAPSRAA